MSWRRLTESVLVFESRFFNKISVADVSFINLSKILKKVINSCFCFNLFSKFDKGSPTSIRIFLLFVSIRVELPFEPLANIDIFIRIGPSD